MQQFEQAANINKKYGTIMAVVATGLTLGCGMLVDKIRNDKAKETADLAAKVGVKNALRMGEGVSLSKNGKAYYDSNVGSTYGALLGAGCGVVSAGVQFLKEKELSKISNMPIANPITNAIFGIGMFALGGWIMGKIADHNTNKAAERKA